MFQSDGTAWDSRGNTLTFHTFRPDASPANGRVVSPMLPVRSPAVGNPHSPGYEPNAYRPSVGYPYTAKQSHYHPTADFAPNGYHHHHDGGTRVCDTFVLVSRRVLSKSLTWTELHLWEL